MVTETKQRKGPSAKALTVKPKNLPAKIVAMKQINSPPDVLATKPRSPSIDVPAARPKNQPANAVPTEGYILEIDGVLKSGYATSDEATKAGLALKKRFAPIRVNVYDANKRTRTPIALPA